MKSVYRTMALLVFGACVSVAATRTVAAPVNTLVPTKTELSELPKFGFTGELVPGVGDRMTSITAGGRFAKLGVEVGDIILSVNGFTLDQSGGWHDALIRARSQGVTTLRLQIRDARTGTVRFRDISVNFSTGQPAAVKAAIVAKQKQLQQLQLTVLQVQNFPEPNRTVLLQQIAARRGILLREIAQLQHSGQ